MKVAVALSGGVDSAVSLCLAREMGYSVFAVHMYNWHDGCCSGASVDADDAVLVANLLDVPIYFVDFSETYKRLVFSQFILGLKNGGTPNPDILCNQEIKFKVLLAYAREMGADILMTGHYCQTSQGKLFKGIDPNKDQSYFLCMVSGEGLKLVEFPIGCMTKEQVRELAKKKGLPVHSKKDSFGICFIGKRDFRSFISKYIPDAPGRIETIDGKYVGDHNGVHLYTLGQSGGLCIGSGVKYFVAGKNVEKRLLTVVDRSDHPVLMSSSLIAKDSVWISDPPAHFPYRCSFRIRHKQPDQHGCIVSCNENSIEVVFDEPQRAITPGQYLAIYSGAECLGGAVIG